MDTFSPDYQPRMELELSDESGVSKVWAYFHHVGTNSYVVLEGDGGGQTEAIVKLWPSTQSSYMAPGEYRCTKIEASDAAGNLSTFTPQSHPQLVNRSFRYEYPGGDADDTEGPELIGFVSQAINTLTAPGRTTDELERLAHILSVARQHNADVEEVRETVRDETPALSSLTDLLPRTRSELYAFIAIILTIVQILVNTATAEGINIQDVDIDVHHVINITTDQQSPSKP